MAEDNRFRNVKQAEYEILKTILTHERINEIMKDSMRSGIVGSGRRGVVARERANKAVVNISGVLRSMMLKRVKHLPEYHIDHGDVEGECL